MELDKFAVLHEEIQKGIADLEAGKVRSGKQVLSDLAFRVAVKEGLADAPIVINFEKQPWPKGDLEQVKAVADLIAASKSPMNLESVAACFSGKGQWKKRLPNILDMLVVVGKARVDERGYVAV